MCRAPRRRGLPPRPRDPAQSPLRRSWDSGRRARGGLDRFDDEVVAGAPAKIAREHLADLVRRRMGMLLEERVGRQQDAGRAVAALEAVLVLEGLLERRQALVRGDALYRR